MKVLLLAAHPDDEVLGCGGTIIRHVEVGDSVTTCIVANRAYGHRYDLKLIEKEKEACRRAKEILGYHQLVFLDLPDEQLDKSQIDLIVPLENVINEIRPDLVYAPHRGDLNQDHRSVFEAIRVACRPYNSHQVSMLRTYEVPSSSDQVSGVCEWPFVPNYYVDISDVLDSKIAAMACYETESRLYPHPRSPDGLRVYAMKRGMEQGLHAAEAFMILRDIWKVDKK